VSYFPQETSGGPYPGEVELKAENARLRAENTKLRRETERLQARIENDADRIRGLQSQRDSFEAALVAKVESGAPPEEAIDYKDPFR
jgi:uncharacterized protein YlxW (UPF0749 family)